MQESPPSIAREKPRLNSRQAAAIAVRGNPKMARGARAAAVTLLRAAGADIPDGGRRQTPREDLACRQEGLSESLNELRSCPQPCADGRGG
jgi:hypothetical protein